MQQNNRHNETNSYLRNSLLTIYKTLVHPHLDYADVIYGKPGNVNFESK